MSLVPPSTKEQIVLTAERLFSERGLEGVSLRHIGVAAGNGNHSVVQYHFGSKNQLVRAIVEYRLSHLDEQRRILTALRRPGDLRSAVECYVLPILEQGEQEGNHYLSFVAMLQQHPDSRMCEGISKDLQVSTRAFRHHIERQLSDIPEPLRSHRIRAGIALSVLVSADRERTQAAGLNVLPFAAQVTDLFDSLVRFLGAPVSAATRSCLADTEFTWVGDDLSAV